MGRLDRLQLARRQCWAMRISLLKAWKERLQARKESERVGGRVGHIVSSEGGKSHPV